MKLDLNENPTCQTNGHSRDETVLVFFLNDILLVPLGGAARIDTPHVIKRISLSTSRLLMEAWKVKQHKRILYVNTHIQKSKDFQWS